jgi:hypothetical protein
LSANPDVVGGILVVVVIGFVVFYAWLEFKKKPHYSPSYSTRHERPETFRNEPQESEEIDAEEIGYKQEMGRQRALAEARRQRQQEAIRKQDRKWAQEYYNNTTLTNLRPPRGNNDIFYLQDTQDKKRKKKQSFYDKRKKKQSFYDKRKKKQSFYDY